MISPTKALVRISSASQCGLASPVDLKIQRRSPHRRTAASSCPSQDGTSVTIRLPAPTVAEPVLDLENSYVADHDKGLANRFKGSDLEGEVQLEAIAKMKKAATGAGNLTDPAKQSTTTMLRGLLGALGHPNITITFDDAPR